MNRPRFAATLAAFALAATAALPASADTLKLLTTSQGHQNVDTSMTGLEAVGQYVAQWNGSTFLTYCTDLFEPFAFNVSYTDYAPAATGSAGGFTARQADLLGRLYTVADNGGSAKVDTLDETVAFQLSVWEIINETASSLRVSGSNKGVFFAESGATSNQLSLANGWLDAIGDARSSAFSVTRLHSNGHQDMLTVTAVPEPSTYAMLLAGLGAMGFISRRRASR